MPARASCPGARAWATNSRGVEWRAFREVERPRLRRFSPLAARQLHVVRQRTAERGVAPHTSRASPRRIRRSRGGGRRRRLDVRDAVYTSVRPIRRRWCCPAGSTGSTAASDALPTRCPLHGSSPLMGASLRRPPQSPGRGGLPSSRRHLPSVPRPLRREILWAVIQSLDPFRGPRPEGPGSDFHSPALRRVTLTVRQASLDARTAWSLPQGGS